jgi:uncharacterized protein (DUF885 family)
LPETGASKQLATLADEYWQIRMINEPLYTTALGDRRYDDQLPQITPQALTQKEGQYASILQRAHDFPKRSLSAKDQLTMAALFVDVEALLDDLRCHLEEWTVDPFSGPQVEFLNVESYQLVRTPVESRAMVKRWQAMGQYLDHHIANLRRGQAANKVAFRYVSRKSLTKFGS